MQLERELASAMADLVHGTWTYTAIAVVKIINGVPALVPHIEPGAYIVAENGQSYGIALVLPDMSLDEWGG